MARNRRRKHTQRPATNKERVIAVQLIRDGLVTTIGVPNDEPEFDEEAIAVGIVKLLKGVFGKRVDAVLTHVFDYRTADLDGQYDAHEMN